MDKILKLSTGILVESRYFDPEATLFSGQCFRARRINEGIEIISGDKKCIAVCKNSDSAEIKQYKTMLITDYPDFFYHYFDLDTDYSAIINSLSRFPELMADLKTGGGIHILRQPLFETIISFIISANNNIPRIKGIIQRICERYGEKKNGFYAFPTPSALADVAAEDYCRLGAGYRSKYLEATVKTILGSDILKELPQKKYADAVGTLMTLKGVGRKVADCICLFALYHTGCYPVDTWIKKRDGLMPAEARRSAAERYGDLAGYAQQYKFYSAVKNKT